MVDVSVVIVSWNAKGHLLNCIQSLENARGELSLEVIVVDNGSDDGGPTAVTQKHPWVRMIETGQNLGFSRGNNLGMRHSAGRYVCLMNSDVIVKPGCLQSLVECMERFQDIGILGPRLTYLDGSYQPSSRWRPTLQGHLARALWLDKLFPGLRWFPRSHLDLERLDQMKDVDVLVGCFWMVRREALDEVGGLDESFFIYAEDNDWCKRFWEAGWRVVYFPGAHAIHVGSASSARDPMRFLREREKAQLQYWRKHKGRLGRLCYAGILLLGSSLRIPVWGMAYMVRPGARESARQKLSQHVAGVKIAVGL